MSNGQINRLIKHCEIHFVYRSLRHTRLGTATSLSRAISRYPCHYLTQLPGQNDSHFADDIFRRNFANEKFCSLIKIPLQFVPKFPVDNKPALVHIMAWRRIGDKPSSGTMTIRFTDAYMRHWGDEFKQHWFEVSWNLCNKHQWNDNQYTKRLFQESGLAYAAPEQFDFVC